MFECGDPAGLIAYAYDECDVDVRRQMARHIDTCPACAAEVSALSSTRAALGAWEVPEPEAGVGLSEALSLALAGPAPAAAPRWYQQPLPAWAQVAAALVIFASGLLLGLQRPDARPTSPLVTVGAPSAPVAGQVEFAPVEGAGTPAAADQSMAGAALAADISPATSADGVTAADLERLAGQLRAEMNRLRAAGAVGVPATRPVTSATAGATTDDLLRQVRALIEESETRQRRELAMRTTEVVRDFELQRRVDLTRIERTLGQMEGTTGAEVAEQRELLNYLVRVSQRQP
ncbi:MAG: anti-sigma factor [Vicinamibacterales bacterium]